MPLFVEKENPTNKPVVSVILPTYNRRNLIGKSIQSVLDQTFVDFELIIIDDASTDATEAAIKEFTDSRIVYFKHPQNRGGAAARNTGIEAAKGTFVAFQDSDDIWLPDKLAKQMVVFDASPASVGVVYTQCSRRKENQEKLIPDDLSKLKNGDIFHTLLPENFITLPSVVMRMACIEKVGSFDETLPRFQDWELFLRIAKHFEFRYLPETLVHSFFTENSISSNQKAYTRAFEMLLTKHSEDYKLDPRLYAKYLFKLAFLYRLEGNVRKSRKYLIETIKINHKSGLILGIWASFFGIKIFDLYWKLKKIKIINKA